MLSMGTFYYLWRRTKAREVAEAVGVSYGTAINIVDIWLSTPEQCLDLFKGNPQKYLRQVVTTDETWIHYYTPEIMVTIFWNSKGIIPMEFLEKGRTITGQYYSELSDRFDEKLKEIRWPFVAHSLTS